MEPSGDWTGEMDSRLRFMLSCDPTALRSSARPPSRSPRSMARVRRIRVRIGRRRCFHRWHATTTNTIRCDRVEATIGRHVARFVVAPEFEPQVDAPLWRPAGALADPVS